jgi:lipase maturation factor 1
MSFKASWLGFGSGPNVARLFQKLVALIFLVAWISLGAQLRVLLSTRGLLPAQEFVRALAEHHVGFFEAPSLFRWGAPDWALVAGVWLGAALALAALAGVFPRALFFLSTLLYLSYAVVARTFLSFQWDNLLLECGLGAALLPTDRAAPTLHLLFRLILFKLYWESGLAKWQSSLGDWQDGSAMTWYYETAPIPAGLAWWAHHPPVAWHHLESWATLFFELVLPLCIFSPRRVRQVAAAFFTFFQLVNALTANYGFFCYLACALHVFLLDDADVQRLFRRPRLPETLWRHALGGVALALFLFISTVEAVQGFAGKWESVPTPWAPFRVVNTYHLFASITRERIEPEFQTSDGSTWTAHDFHYKPGDLARRPPYVAPHQPRVDFQLWFYGLSYRHGSPEYVVNLLERLCHDPEAVQPLFTAPLPPHPNAVRIVYWQYHFSTAEERAHSGAWWRRESRGETRAIPCDP